MKARILLVAANEDLAAEAPYVRLACARAAQELRAHAHIARRYDIVLSAWPPGEKERAEDPLRPLRPHLRPEPKVIVVVAESWRRPGLPGLLGALRATAPQAQLCLSAGACVPQTVGPSDTLAVPLHGDLAQNLAALLSTGGSAKRDRACRQGGSRQARGSRQPRASLKIAWRSPYCPATARYLIEGQRPVILEHARAARGGQGRVDSAPETRLVQDLRFARRHRVRRAVLSYPLLNPSAAHVARLARVFSEHGGDLALSFARWRPGGPRTSPIVDLLRRFETLEIDYPSRANAAFGLGPPAPGPEVVAADLAWLRRCGIEPRLCVWAGLPGDNEASLLETMRGVFALRPVHVQVRPVTAAPGSWLFEHREEYGLVVMPEPPHVVLAHRDATPFELRWMLELCRAAAIGYGYWTRLAGAALTESRAARPSAV